MAPVWGTIHAADWRGVRASTPGGHNVPQLIPQDAPMFFEWKEFFTPVFRNSPDIMQYHRFCFDAVHPDVLYLKKLVDKEESSLQILRQPGLASQLVNCPCRLPTRGSSWNKLQKIETSWNKLGGAGISWNELKLKQLGTTGTSLLQLVPACSRLVQVFRLVPIFSRFCSAYSSFFDLVNVVPLVTARSCAILRLPRLINREATA